MTNEEQKEYATLTTAQKLQVVQQMPEITKAVSILIAAFHDCELKSHIRFAYQVEGTKYEITFLPIINELTYKPQSND